MRNFRSFKIRFSGLLVMGALLLVCPPSAWAEEIAADPVAGPPKEIQKLGAILDGGDDESRLTAIGIINEMGKLSPDKNVREQVRILGPNLARLVKEGSPEVKAAAAKALGRIHPAMQVGAPAVLASLLDSKNKSNIVRVRRAGAEGLGSLIYMVSQLGTVTYQDRLTGSPEAGRVEVITTGKEVVTEAAKGLNDPDPVVRRLCLQAIQSSAEIFAMSEIWPGLLIKAKPAEILPLAQALQDQGAKVAGAPGDNPEAGTRQLAARIFAEMNHARRRLHYHAYQPEPGEARDNKAEVVLMQGVLDVVPTLLTWLRNDPDAQVQRAVLEAIAINAKSLGKQAAPVVSGVTMKLDDPDRFVRWTAARTLGRIGPVSGAKPDPVERLAQRLNDPDLDVRIAVALALGRYGSAAEKAVPFLLREIDRIDYLTLVLPLPPCPPPTGGGGSGWWGMTRVPPWDPEMRLAAIQALENIGGDVKASIPTLVRALGYENRHVRSAAAEALGIFGRKAEPEVRKQAVKALTRALEDPDPDVRKAASTALLAIMSS